MSKEKHWGVDVRVNHEHILTIESNCLSGKSELSDEENDAIYRCGEHLIGFARKPKDTPETRTDFAVFDTLDRFYRDGWKIHFDADNERFMLLSKNGALQMLGSSFRDLCVNIVLAGL